MCDDYSYSSDSSESDVEWADNEFWYLKDDLPIGEMVNLHPSEKELLYYLVADHPYYRDNLKIEWDSRDYGVYGSNEYIKFGVREELDYMIVNNTDKVSNIFELAHCRCDGTGHWGCNRLNTHPFDKEIIVKTCGDLKRVVWDEIIRPYREYWKNPRLLAKKALDQLNKMKSDITRITNRIMS